MTAAQLDFFGPPSSSPAVLREERRLGTWDAKTGLPLENWYSRRIAGDRLEAYQQAYRKERRR